MSTTKFQFLALKDAAELVGLTTGRLRQMLRAGELVGEKLAPRLWVIPRHEVEKLAKSRKKR